MAIPSSLKPKPYKLKKGETIPKVLRAHGFGTGDENPIMRLPGNKPLIKKFGSIDDVPAGETFFIPVMSLKQSMDLWGAFSAIGSTAGQIRENTLHKALKDARRDVEKIRKDIRKLWDILGPDAQNLRRAKDKCQEQIPKGMRSRDIDDCLVAIEKYLDLRKDLDRALDDKASKLDADLANAEQNLAVLEKRIPQGMSALDTVVKMADGLMKSSNELSGMFK